VEIQPLLNPQSVEEEDHQDQRTKMDNRITYVTDAEGTKFPAEVRSCIPQSELVAVYKDFHTSRLQTLIFRWKDEGWISPEGFTAVWDTEVAERPEVTVRLSR
jgi:hypothetical protein